MFTARILLDENVEIEVEFNYKPGVSANFRGMPDRWFPREDLELDILNVYPSNLEERFDEYYKLNQKDIDQQLIDFAEQEIENMNVEAALRNIGINIAFSG